MMRASIKALENSKLGLQVRDMGKRRYLHAESGVGSQNREKKMESGVNLGFWTWESGGQGKLCMMSHQT